MVSRPASAAVLAVVLIAGLLLRLSFLAWQSPWTPHHPDEHILPLEALALWEGVTPREVGWPAATTRLLLSGIAGLDLLLEQGALLWQRRDAPNEVLSHIATWIGDQYVAPANMYRLGRGLSALLGCLHLLAAWWCARRWIRSDGASQVVSLLLVTVSPVAVLHSQYILADTTGALFATILVGLAGEPTRGRVLGMAVLAGLAAASKLHFGVWLLTPLLSIAAIEHRAPRTRAALGLTAAVVLVFACTFLLLVPWWIINPFLALREFASVVGTKLGESGEGVTTRTAALFGGLGILTWLGAAVGIGRPSGAAWRLVTVSAPAALATVAMLAGSVTFDRYGLVLLPGMAVLAARGWEFLLSQHRPALRSGAWALVAACVVLTLWQLRRDITTAAAKDVDVATAEWIIANVPRGSRVAVHHEWLALVPRTAASLDACASYAATEDAYREKWRILGFDGAPTRSAPMRSGLMADEIFAAYWCRRERTARQGTGYLLTPYHTEPRFRAHLEADVLRAFASGDVLGEDRPIDVLVLNRAQLEVAPAHVIQSRRGQRVIYLRPGAPGSASARQQGVER